MFFLHKGTLRIIVAFLFSVQKEMESQIELFSYWVCGPSSAFNGGFIVARLHASAVEKITQETFLFSRIYVY